MTPRDAAGRVVASLVMLTTIPLLAAVFALVTGAAAAAGIRRVLAMGHRLPSSGYRLVVGMDDQVHAILDEIVRVGDADVLVADVDPAGVRPEVHLVRGDPTKPAAIRAARPADAQQALITGPTDGDVLISAVLLREQAPELPVVGLGAVGISPRGAAGTRRPADHLRRAADRAHAGHEPGGAARGRHAGPAGGIEPAQPGRDRGRCGRDRQAAERGSAASGTGWCSALVHDGRCLLGVDDDPVVSSGDRLLIAQPAPRKPVRR